MSNNVTFTGTAVKIVRKRKVDDAGIHYPIHEIVVAVNDMVRTEFYHVPIGEARARMLYGRFTISKNKPVVVNGQVVLEQKKVNDTWAHELKIVNARVSSLARLRKRSRKKKGEWE